MTGKRKSQDAIDLVWNGQIYRRHPNHKNRSMRLYYMATTAPRNYLHRDMWEYHNGPIPDGWHVHHADGDALNNVISNFSLLSPSAHAALHAKEIRQVDAVCNQCGTAFMATFSRAKWCSAACKERYRRINGTAYKRPRKPFSVEKECRQCGSHFTSKKPWGVFCSSACKQRFSKGVKRDG